MHLFIIIMNDEAIASVEPVRDSCCAITRIAFLFNEFSSHPPMGLVMVLAMMMRRCCFAAPADVVVLVSIFPMKRHLEIETNMENSPKHDRRDCYL